MSLFKKIALNTLVSYAGRIVGSALALVAVGIMTRSLGRAGFGGYTTAVAYLSLFVIFADFGLQSLMTREISKSAGDVSKISGNFFTLRLVSSLIFLLAGVLASTFFPYSQAVKAAIAIGAVGYFFLSASQLILSVFQRYLAMHLEAIAQIAGRATQLGLVYLIYTQYAGSPPFAEGYGGAQPTSHILLLFIGAMSVASGVIFVLMFVFARRYIKFGFGFDFSYWKSIIKTTWPIALSIVLTLVYFKIDTIFLSLMKPEADVGIYGVSYKILESLIFFPAMFSGIMMPFLSRNAIINMEQFKVIFQRSMRAISIFAFPVMAGGWALSYSVANIIGGNEFLAAGAPMQPLFLATGIIFFGNILGRAIIALDLQKKAVLAYLSGVLLNILLNLIFIPKYTYMGAAWTTVITEFFVVLFLFYLVRKYAGVSLGVLNMAKAAFAAALMGIILFMFLSPITVPVSFLNIAAFTILGAIIYFGILLAVKGVSVNELLFSQQPPH